VGGVRTAEDVVEMTMVGATAVGMVARPLLQGLQVFDQVEQQLREHLAGRTVADINGLRGLTHRRIAEMQMQFDGRALIDEARCTNCGLCVRVCFQRAPMEMETEDTTRIQPQLCVGCGLCVSVCPQGAIALSSS
jgi:Pyruvate/2-oxoacid:ferredoxin oxidoreductase delta subunit